MDISPIHIQSGIILAIVLGFMVLKRNRYVKGWLGEFIVNLMARFYLEKKEYHLIKNVTLPTEDSTTQIDHIIVAKYGIFVVETKNMKGWIFGREKDSEWTQQIYNHKNKFQNPLRQNYRHTIVLEEILGLMPDRVFSVIVFIGESTFKTEMPENVTFARGYIDYIKSKTEPLFGEFEVEDIIKKIKDYRLDPGIKTHKQHIQNLKNQHSKKINRKLRRASRKPTSPFYKFIVIIAVLLVFGSVAKRTIFNKQDESVQQEANDSITSPLDQQEDSPTQIELNKIYQHKDAQGKTRYTNVATAPDAKLVDENQRFTAKPLPIEINGNKVIIPVSIRNKGIQMETRLILEEDSPITILPLSTANFFEAEILGIASVTIANGKTVTGEKRRVSYFAVGDTVEQNFIFLAIDKASIGNMGILGRNFQTRHPFSIDHEKIMLIWQ